MTLEIYLVRHGESEVNEKFNRWSKEEKRICGTNTWSELTAEGIGQAQDLGKYFAEKGHSFDRIYSSPAIRAQQTARHCLENMGYDWPKFKVDERLTELSQGQWEGNLDYKTRTDDVWLNINAMGWHFTPPDGESQYDVYQRANEFIEQEILRQESYNALVFTHNNVIGCLLTGLMGLERHKIHEIKLYPTSITTLHYESGELDRVERGEFPHLCGGAFA